MTGLRARHGRWHAAGTGGGGGGTLPANTVAPVATTDGTPATGETVTAGTGTWTGSPTPTFTYQWKRDGANIAGATASSYVLVTADAGHSIKCTVTATNASGAVSQDTNAFTPSAGPWPNTLQTEIMADAPVAYWRGTGYRDGVNNDRITDDSGNLRTLQVFNDGAGGAGYPKAVASLIPSEGTSPAIDIIVNSNFWNPVSWPTITGSWSLSFWTKLRAASLAGSVPHDVARSTHYGVVVGFATPNYVLQAFVDRSATNTINSAPIAINTLYHVAAVYKQGTGTEGSGTGTLELYVNNVRTVLTGLGAAAVVGAATFVLGQFAVAANGLDGTLDEVAVYNTALTTARVNAHYHAGLGS